MVLGKEWAKNSNYITVGKEGFFEGDNILEQEQNGGWIILFPIIYNIEFMSTI